MIDWREQSRANAGAAGADGETFDQIDALGEDRWLGMLREELVSGGNSSASCCLNYQQPVRQDSSATVSAYPTRAV